MWLVSLYTPWGNDLAQYCKNTRFNSEGEEREVIHAKVVTWGQSLKRKEMSYSQLGSIKISNEKTHNIQGHRKRWMGFETAIT